MGRALANEYSLEIEAEGTFNSGSGIFSGSQKIGGVFGVDLSSVRNPVIEDQTYTLDGGSHEGIEGVPHPEIGVPFSMHFEGLGTAAGDGDTPVSTAQIEVCALAAQVAPLPMDGDTTSGTPTTTSIVETTAGAHEPAGSYTIVPVVLPSGAIEARGGTYSTDTFTALQVYTETPAGGAVTYGGVQLYHGQTWAGAAGRSGQLRFLGSDTNQHRKLLGCVIERSVAAVGPQDVPTWAFNARGASFEDLFSDTRVAPTLNRRKVFAGADLVLSKFGNTAIKAAQWLRIEMNDALQYIADEDGNNSSGIVGWTRAKSVPQVMITLPHDETPPSAIGSATYRESKRDGGADALYQLCVTFGRTAGQSYTRYYPKLRLKSWQQTTVDELDAQVLTFEPATGVSEMFTELWW